LADGYSNVEERVVSTDAPRKLWKTEIVVWTEYQPKGMNPHHLMRDAQMNGHVHVAGEELVSNPYEQDDGPPREAFETRAS
jgi:hypothetical protein